MTAGRDERWKSRRAITRSLEDVRDLSVGDGSESSDGAGLHALVARLGMGCDASLLAQPRCKRPSICTRPVRV